MQWNITFIRIIGIQNTISVLKNQLSRSYFKGWKYAKLNKEHNFVKGLGPISIKIVVRLTDRPDMIIGVCQLFYRKFYGVFYSVECVAECMYDMLENLDLSPGSLSLELKNLKVEYIKSFSIV